ncbi:MAG: polyprenyl synthetase family protein [Schwartzia sp.]|nr:polyprenyl synthetase family protein [Schwartzia sp. (in: firmicutes)]MBR1884877.1 polyprenyl synthetase family protein [Schwartzia sp. (in: firmicutes)]
MGQILEAKDIFRCIAPELAALEDMIREALASPAPLIAEAGEHLVSSGGKRLRPALYLLAAKSCEGYDEQKAMPLAAAVELIHMASLVHDDVIDHAETRRGTATVNAKWGSQVAVLTGDYMFAHSYSLISKRGYTEDVGDRLAAMVQGLCAGEILQDSSLYTTELDVAEYERRIAMKTADFLAICCELGGMVGGAAPEVSRGLRAYGKAVGMAFQITDDLLDVTGDEQRLGKPAGNDIRQGVVTLPVIYALETSRDRDELRRILTNRAMADDEVARAIEIVRASDGIQRARTRVDAYIEEARRVLPEAVGGEERTAFLEAAAYIGQRDF